MNTMGFPDLPWRGTASEAVRVFGDRLVGATFRPVAYGARGQPRVVVRLRADDPYVLTWRWPDGEAHNRFRGDREIEIL